MTWKLINCISVQQAQAPPLGEIFLDGEYDFLLTYED